jgi:hypothetical protein
VNDFDKPRPYICAVERKKFATDIDRADGQQRVVNRFLKRRMQTGLLGRHGKQFRIALGTGHHGKGTRKRRECLIGLI